MMIHKTTKTTLDKLVKKYGLGDEDLKGDGIMAGCSNHGCIIDPDKKGMGTNGLCHCLDPMRKEDARALRRRISELEAKAKQIDPEWRYRNDIKYHNYVERFESILLDKELSPSELMESVMLACVHYASRPH